MQHQVYEAASELLIGTRWRALCRPPFSYLHGSLGATLCVGDPNMDENWDILEEGCTSFYIVGRDLGDDDA